MEAYKREIKEKREIELQEKQVEWQRAIEERKLDLEERKLQLALSVPRRAKFENCSEDLATFGELQNVVKDLAGIGLADFQALRFKDDIEPLLANLGLAIRAKLLRLFKADKQQ